MDPKKQLQDLLRKPMSRKEFLTHIGASLLGVMGVSALIRNFSNPYASKKQPVNTRRPGNTYGSVSYGGKKK